MCYVWGMQRGTSASALAGLVILALAACRAEDTSERGAIADEHLTESTLALSSVTVLAPLASYPTLLTADTPIGDDALVPRDARAGFGQLVEHFTPDETVRDLRVVCTRFVPCARPIQSGDRRACAGQVRFVLQPVRPSSEGSPTAQDAAVHVFYELSDDVTRTLATRLASAPGAHDRGALGVSSSESTQATQALAVDIASKGSPARVTFIRNVDVKGNTWVFGGHDRRGGGWAPIPIPRTTDVEQRVVTNGSWPFAISVTPRPTTDPSLGLLLDPTRLGILAESSPEAAKDRVSMGHRAALAIEDPHAHDTNDIDCASCHVAGVARRFGVEIASARGFGPLPEPTPVVPGMALKATDDGRTPAASLRACGYVGQTPVLSQRVVNETALAAVQMGQRSEDGTGAR